MIVDPQLAGRVEKACEFSGFSAAYAWPIRDMTRNNCIALPALRKMQSMDGQVAGNKTPRNLFRMG